VSPPALHSRYGARMVAVAFASGYPASNALVGAMARSRPSRQHALMGLNRRTDYTTGLASPLGFAAPARPL